MLLNNTTFIFPITGPGTKIPLAALDVVNLILDALNHDPLNKAQMN